MPKPETCRLSLLTAYRNRPSHLGLLLDWLSRARQQDGFADFELILAEGDNHPTALAMCEAHGWVRYIFVEMGDLFNKSVLLNRAASVARGTFVMPLDIDLLPGRNVLSKHVSLAERSVACLLSGFRIQLPSLPDPVEWGGCAEIAKKLDRTDPSLICEEDRYATGLVERLLDRRRFGVCPCFLAERFHAAGGYHEGYVGWGAEDQDLIERICATGIYLVRCYDLLYFHMPHPAREPGWRDERLTAANRALYFSRRKSWMTDIHG